MDVRSEDPPYQSTSSQFDPFLDMEPNSVTADEKGLTEGELIMNNAEKTSSLKRKKEYLQDHVKSEDTQPAAQVKVTHFQNWGNTQKSLLLYVKPTTRTEICKLVEAASSYPENQIKVGVGGSYHSWSPMFPDDGGLLINTCDLKLESWSSDKYDATDGKQRIYLHGGHKLVTISPGVTTGELMHFFLLQNICFESDVILPTVTYGGVLSGGCHGVGKDQTSMCDWITSLTLVDGNGKLQTIPSDGNPDALCAAQVGLGLLGVVVEYTLEVKEMSYCRVQNIFDKTLEEVVGHPSLLKESSDKLAKLLQDHWSVELFWFPFSSIFDWLLNSLPSQKSDAITLQSFPKGNPELIKGSLDNMVANVQLETIPITTQEASAHAVLDEEEGIAISEEDFMLCEYDQKEEVTEAGSLLEERCVVALKFNKPISGLIEQIWRLMMNNSHLLSGILERLLTPEFVSHLLGALWGPYKDKVWIRAIDKSDHSKLSREPGLPSLSKMMDLAAHTGGKNLLTPALKEYPGLTPVVHSFTYQGLKFQYGTLQGDEVVKTPWAIHYRDGIDYMPCYDMEFAFPVKITDPIRAVKAIRECVDVTKKYADKGWFSPSDKTNSYPLTLCMEMRVMKKCDSLLNPASLVTAPDEEHIVYIEILSMVDTPDYDKYFGDVADRWMKLGGVPHWQKQWAFLESQGKEIFEHLKEKYGQRLTSFETVREKFDPSGIFMNETWKKLFKN